jgi:hypothetical protein
VFPLRLPAPFCEDVGDAAVLEIAKETFYHTHPISQHKGQPVTIAGFAVSEREAAECSASPEDGVNVPNTEVRSGRSLNRRTSTVIGCRGGRSQE